MFLFLRLCGYANALTFKNITNDDIDSVENFIKNDALNYLSSITALNESERSGFVKEDEVLVDNQQLIDYFGKLYASQPQNFRFQSGDRILIKALVERVKDIVDKNGINAGLKKFKNKKNIKTKSKSKKQESTTQSTLDLKIELTERVKKCMFSYGADKEFNIHLENDINIDIVTVCVENGLVNGTVRCIICDKQKKRKNLLKKVHYSSGSKWPGWVLSNFAKHLKCHGLEFHELENKSDELIENDDSAKEGSNCNGQDAIRSDLEQINNQKVDLDNSVVCLNISDHHVSQEIRAINANIVYTQLSSQITLMMSAVMTNSESQEQIFFKTNDNDLEALTVAEIPGDGSCLFSALVHQLENGKINGKTHQSATTKLRSDVVKYILNEENYPKFAHQLQGRIYDFKNKSDIENITVECKLFVKFVLSQNKCWGGAETISAVSEMKQVNIALFCENGPCYMQPKFNKHYNRTICIAYRQATNKDVTTNEKIVRNHYDSVCDMSSDALYKAAQIIIN